MQLLVNEAYASISVSEPEIWFAFSANLVDGDVAILEVDDSTYIQVVQESSGWILEYQNGSLTEHYNIIGNPLLAKAAVIEIFVKYLKHDDSWKASFNWEPTQL